MKSLTEHIKRVGLAVVALSGLVVYQNANAAVGETSAGTDITNTATVNYQVSGVAQTAVPSNTSTFKVDRKVIFTVAERSGGPTTPVAPAQLNVVTSFNVSNTGNAAEGFQLTPTNLTGGTVFGNTDNRDMSNLRVFVDSNGNNTYDAGVDTATVINSLARDTTVTVFIVADAPVTANNGDFANVRLTARAAVAGGGAATLETESASDTAGTVDVVIADTGRDNTEAADDEYAIVSANLAVAKSAVVISDPINGTTTPKAIPGAVVEYTITVTNSGTAAATSVVLSDDIPASSNTVFVPGSMRLGATTLTDGADADAGTYTSTGTPNVTVNAGTVAASGGTATVKFRVTIN